MAAKRRPHRSRGSKSARRRSALTLRRLSNTNRWELVHPRCVRQRAEDMEEVRAMIEADETDVAVDELRYLLDGCTDFVEAHYLLGEIAFGDGDVKLARAHFGYAYDIATAALPAGGVHGTLPYDVPVNQNFFQAAKGLCSCLHQLGRDDQALEIAKKMTALDPSDPLAFADLAESIRDSAADRPGP